METVKVKLLNNPDNPNLKMKYVGAVEYATPRLGKDAKTITGLDENAYSIITIEDSVVKKQKQSEIKKEREELEKLLGRDLSPNSEFWDEFHVILSDDELTFDPLNPMDRLKERFLVANRYVAPSIDAIENDEDFQNCVYYLHRDKEETTKKAKKKMDSDKVKFKLFGLKESNPNKLKQVYSYVFGYDATNDIEIEEAYLKLSESLDEKDEKALDRNIKLFLEAESKTSEQLQTKLILDKAVKKRLVTSKGNVYRRGDIILGNSYAEAVEFLSSIENQAELSSLMKEIERKK